MAVSAPVRALALVLFVAGIAGATYAVTQVVGDTVGSQLVGVTPARSTLNVTPGHNATFALSLANRDLGSRDLAVEIDGLAAGRSEIVSVRGNATSTLFVTVSVPVDANVGQHDLTLRIVTDDGRTLRTRDGLLSINVLPAGPGLSRGDTAEAIYTGRLAATGRVFNTNDPALAALPTPKTDSYHFSQGLLPITTVPRPNVVPGLAEEIDGMQPGESRSVTFGPAKGYGPASEEQTEPRQEAITRDLTLLNDEQQVPRTAFNEYINETRQGNPLTFQVGDVFRLEDENKNVWPYRVVNLSSEMVGYKVAASVGEAYTIYPFWTNASVITLIDDTQIKFRTTPTTEPGKKFTMRQYWPDMSTLVEYNDTRIVVEHTPRLGYTYTSISSVGQPREATVQSVTAETIVVAIPSANPLAGKDLTFDITLVTLDKRPAP